MEVDAKNGGRFSKPVLDVNNDGEITDLDRVLIDGTYCQISVRGTDEMIKTPAIIKGDGVEF
jgi:type IV pilus assembly protein PilY1